MGRPAKAGPEGAALWGVLRCAALELPSLNWRGVDHSIASPLDTMQVCSTRFMATTNHEIDSRSNVQQLHMVVLTTMLPSILCAPADK